MNNNSPVSTPHNQDEKEQKIKELVLARLGKIPEDMDVFVGDSSYQREELKKHVQNNDEIGKQLTEIELDFLKEIASGKIYLNE